MYIAYLIALIPIAIGAFFWLASEKITFTEWMIGTLIVLVCAVGFNGLAANGLTEDIEMWNGKITSATYTPQWTEEYEEEHTITDSDGNVTSRWYSTEHEIHYPEWTAHANFGKHDEDYNISREMYLDILQKFGRQAYHPGSRSTWKDNSHMIAGDPNDYYVINITDYIYPVHTAMKFENKVKAAPSVYSFPKVPEGTVGVYDWPTPINKFVSRRLMGISSKSVDITSFDQMNTRLGPTKKVNVIIVGWDADKFDSSIAHIQEAKWVGGRKNDLVLCYGESNGKTVWSYVFGWTERELVKRNLETILLDNKVNTDLLPAIEQEIIKNYELKEWKKFDYLTVEIPTSWYVWYTIIMLIISVGFWWYAFDNEFERDY